MFKEQV